MADDATPSVERLLTESVWLDGLARSLLRDDESEAEDVAQEARLAALREAPSDPAHARAWLARVTRNLALRVRLRRTRRERRERGAAVPESLPATVDLVARVQAQRRVADAVVALDDPYRSVVLLRYFDALTARDIAVKQGVPIETVRTRLRRALARLRERLDRDFGSRDAWAGLLLPWASPIAVASATTAKVAGAGGAAVATGAATMSLTTKLALAAAVVAAAALIWRGAASSNSTKDERASERVRGVATPAVAAAAVSESAAGTHTDAVVDPTSNPATRVVEPVATAPATPAPSQEATILVHATIVSAADGKPVEGAMLSISFQQQIGEKATYDQSMCSSSSASGSVELNVPATATMTPRVEIAAKGFATSVDAYLNLSRAVDRRLDLGTLKLERGVLVKGRVLRARDREPIARAELRLDVGQWSSELKIDTARRQGESDATGDFVLNERVWQTNGARMVLFALTDRGVGWKAFNVVGGVEEVDGVDVLVDEPATLTVTVRDETGALIPSSDVCCTPSFTPMAPSRRGEWTHSRVWVTEPRTKALFTRRTDAEGLATFDALPTGSPAFGGSDEKNRYDVVATAEGHEVGFVDGLQLTPGGSARCDVVLHRTRAITVVGRVTGLDGEPIPDAHVEVWGSPSSFTLTTDERGEYRVDGVPTTTRTVYVTVTADRHDRHQQLYRIEELPRAALEDAAGQPLDAVTIDVKLERAVQITGRVVDESGVPIAGATTWFRPIGRIRFGVFDTASYHADPPETDAQGRFCFEATEGEWQVSAAARLADGTMGPATELRVKGGADDLVLVCATRAVGGAKLECDVVDAATGAPLPIASASVRTADELIQRDMITRRDFGRIEANHLDVNRWRLDVEVGDHRRATREFDVKDDHDDVRLRFEIGAMARVAGRIVVDPAVTTSDDATSGKPRWYVWWNPLEGFAVDAAGRVAGDPKNACTRPGPDGRFFLDGIVPAVTTRIHAGDWDQLFDEVVFTPASGEKREVVLTMRPAAHWIVERADDFSSGNLVVDLAMGEEPWHREVWMDRMVRDAKDFPRAIKPGKHRWRALFADTGAQRGTSPCVRSAEGEFDVAAGETYVLRLSGLR